MLGIHFTCLKFAVGLMTDVNRKGFKDFFARTNDFYPSQRTKLNVQGQNSGGVEVGVGERVGEGEGVGEGVGVGEGERDMSHKRKCEAEDDTAYRTKIPKKVDVKDEGIGSIGNIGGIGGIGSIGGIGGIGSIRGGNRGDEGDEGDEGVAGEGDEGSKGVQDNKSQEQHAHTEKAHTEKGLFGAVMATLR